MKFFSQLFGKKSDADDAASEEISPKIATEIPEIPKSEITIEYPELQGSEVGDHIASLLITCETGEWVPVASLQIVCNNCENPIHLDYSHPALGEGVGFRYKGNFVNLDYSLTCEKCQSTTFRIENHKVDFKRWLQQILRSLEPCADDLSIGFEGSESGQPIKHHNFTKADSFDAMWSAVAPHVNPQGTIIDNFTFNYIDMKDAGPKRINRTAGICHQNSFTNELIVVVKDRHDVLWYRILQE